MIASVAPGLLLAGSALNALLVIYLLTRRPHRAGANVWLALLLMALTLRFGKSAVQGFIDVGAVARNVGLAGMLGIGPTLLAYVSHRPVPRTLRDAWSVALHALPALVLLFGAAVVPNAPENAVAAVIYLLILSHLATYLIAAWRALRRTSNPTQDGLRITFAAAITAYWLAWCGIAAGVPYLYVGLCAVHALGAAALCWLALSRHPWLASIWDSERYSHLLQSSDEAAALLARATRLVNDDRLFADPQLTIERLARRLVVPRNELSRAINAGTGRTFRSWLNDFRVAHAREALERGWLDDRRLIDLAEASGFASLSSFNRAFRTVTGVAPSQYGRKQQVPR